MGQLCSSDQIQHDHRASQQRKKIDLTSRHHPNDHYSQGNVDPPPAPLYEEENNSNYHAKPLYCPEDGQTNYNALYRPYNENNKQNWVKPDQYNQQNKDNTAQETQESPSYSSEGCPICENSFEILYEKPVFTICHHAFCPKCLKIALKILAYCPVCCTYQSKSLYNAKGEIVYDVDADQPAESFPKALWNLDFVRTVVEEKAKKEERNCVNGTQRTEYDPADMFKNEDQGKITEDKEEWNPLDMFKDPNAVKVTLGEMGEKFFGKEGPKNVNMYVNGKRVESTQAPECNVQ